METNTQCDLNEAIQRWRENLGQSPAFRHENLDELESHLRDAVATLQTHGLDTEEAFLVATKRLGKSSQLESEFAKQNSRFVWLDRALWMLIGIQVWELASSFTGSITRNALGFRLNQLNYSYKENGVTLAIILLGIVQLVTLAASVYLCWWLIVRHGRNFGERLGQWLQRRSGFVACCVALGMASLLVYAFSYSLQLLLIRSSTPEMLGQFMRSVQYSKLIVWSLQIVTMIATTLLLARKRLRLNGA